jgi:toxin ParE1/3/4
VKLLWSRYALEDRREIYAHIEADDPRAALRVDEAITTTIETLIDFSHVGRMGRVHGTREIVISHTPYVAAYKIDGNTIFMLRILHGARIWPEGFEA